ncbi:unnamed protein product [Ixodes pacificus]
MDSIHVLKLLFLSGDIELNPGPPKEDENKNIGEILAAIKSLSTTMETRHAEVMSSLNEVKASQKLLEDRMSDMNVRLAAVESKVDALEGIHDVPDVPRLVAEAVRDENFALQCRLDDYEDRSRRDNLILYGIPDSPTETWTQSEHKVRSLLLESFSLQLPEEAISRAHRLGTFVVNKCRPIVVKFI